MREKGWSEENALFGLLSLIQMPRDECGVAENLWVLHSYLKRLLDLLIRRFKIPIGGQRPRVVIQCEDVLAALDFAFGDLQRLLRAMRVST